MTALNTAVKRANPMAQVLGHRDFRLLWLGQATSLVGNQFALIALSWPSFRSSLAPDLFGIAASPPPAPLRSRELRTTMHSPKLSLS